MSKKSESAPSRRKFLKTSGSAVAAGTALSQIPIENVVHAAGSDTVSVALVGCGGRGSGAIAQIRNTRGNTRLVAVADVNAKKAKDDLDTGMRHVQADFAAAAALQEPRDRQERVGLLQGGHLPTFAQRDDVAAARDGRGALRVVR